MTALGKRLIKAVEEAVAIAKGEASPASWRIELPLPPTANNAFPTNWKTKRRYLSARGKAWKEEAGWLIQMAKPPKFSGPYTFQILIPEKARGDADGYGKLPQDILVELGVTPDDRKAKDSRGTRDASVPTGRCILVVGSVA
jgi:Holliday junction resolvase RusA-like endonuclease